MRWTKRLKWIRASKIIIPIALAISLVFAGFSVYAKEAEFFVLRIDNDTGVSLSLTMNRDLSGQTSRLQIPVKAKFDNATYIPDKNLKYNPNKFDLNLPDDIAYQHDGEHSVWENSYRYSFFSFSFWLVNNSDRAVDVDMRFNIDSVVVGKGNNSGMRVDEAVRVMIIEGEPESLVSGKPYRIYKKAEKTEQAEHDLLYGPEHVEYGSDRTLNFESDSCVFNRYGDLGFRGMKEGATIRFTVVVWLEGNDPECKDAILGDSLKMSINFSGH